MTWLAIVAIHTAANEPPKVRQVMNKIHRNVGARGQQERAYGRGPQDLAGGARTRGDLALAPRGGAGHLGAGGSRARQRPGPGNHGRGLRQRVPPPLAGRRRRSRLSAPPAPQMRVATA